MKRILSLLVLLVAFTSCEEDVKFNTPAVQALKDKVLWKATQFTATRGSNNSLTVTATNGFETVILKTSKVNPGTYTLGVNETNKATYSLDADGITEFYQTGTDLGNGEIIISSDKNETDLTAGFISGTFHFNAEDSEANNVNFYQGVFYKVSIAPAP
jgi:hypothetical protein